MSDLHLEELIVSLVKPLVDHPDDVQVFREENPERTMFRLSVNREDTGKIIGKKGALQGRYALSYLRQAHSLLRKFNLRSQTKGRG